MYQVYSPDGIEIAPRTYRSQKAAQAALAEWSKRYTAQGYYRDNRWNKIPHEYLSEECSIIKL